MKHLSKTREKETKLNLKKKKGYLVTTNDICDGGLHDLTPGMMTFSKSLKISSQSSDSVGAVSGIRSFMYPGFTSGTTLLSLRVTTYLVM